MRALSKFALIGALLLGVGCEEQAPAELKSDDEKTIYALGLALARNLEPYRLSEVELAVFERGLRDGVAKAKPVVTLEEWGPKIQELARARAAAAASAEVAASQAFVEAAAAEEGAEKLGSGLIFRETQAGTGASPQAADTVRVNYHGTLRDGSVFDSSVERGVPAQFPLNRVIPCWTEALQKMKPGGKAHITCPAAIAYGDAGAPPRIPPGAALAFDVELLEILPTAGAEPESTQ